MQPKRKTETTGITALYCRLSRDDGTESESNSIGNQGESCSKRASRLFFPASLHREACASSHAALAERIYGGVIALACVEHREQHFRLSVDHVAAV